MITYKKLGIEEIDHDFLKNFNRYHDVKKCWRKDNNEWVLKNIAFIEQWNEKDKADIVKELQDTIEQGGSVIAAYHDLELLGFASVEGKKIGSKEQYAILHQIQIDYGHRGKGIGRVLFLMECQFAKSLGASKLYISAHSSEETQAFYTRMGCVDAQEIDAKLYELEPYDRHMEYLL